MVGLVDLLARLGADNRAKSAMKIHKTARTYAVKQE
jgi:hypothetical protein